MINITSKVENAIRKNEPVVALESTVITHGLPFPENYDSARNMEKKIMDMGAIPATIAIIHGVVRVGITEEELSFISKEKDLKKISVRDYGYVIAKKLSGGTTVAGTLVAANLAGIKVFATGGIGGVHYGGNLDVSADLLQLSKTPMIVVCAGAKAILDLAATLEMLETYGVPVVGYQTNEFPAFYTRQSGLKASAIANTPEEVADIAVKHWQMGMQSAILLVMPPPEELALSKEVVDDAVAEALKDAEAKKITGQAVTPFLLDKVSKLTKGDSMRTNLALLENNSKIAAQVAIAYSNLAQE